MAWLVFESLLAGAILVGIVWWTMRPARRRDRDHTDRDHAATPATPREGEPPPDERA
jgi:hypothetical protein